MSIRNRKKVDTYTLLDYLDRVLLAERRQGVFMGGNLNR
jgi:hypothetical protein